MPTLVTLATYEQSKTAYFLKEKLESENIDCFFAIISTSENKWDEVRVQVKEEDVEKAIRIMLHIKDEHGMDIEKIEPANLLRRIEDSKSVLTVLINAIISGLEIPIYAIPGPHSPENFADIHQTNLLSFTVHKRGIFEKLFKPNLFKKILQESNLPILLFPS